MQVEISFKTVLKFIFNQDFTAQKRYNYVFQKYFLTMKVFSHSFPFQKAKQSPFIFCLFAHFHPMPHSSQLLHFYVFSVRSTNIKRCKLNSENMSQKITGGSQEKASRSPHKQGWKKQVSKNQLLAVQQLLIFSQEQKKQKQIWREEDDGFLHIQGYMIFHTVLYFAPKHFKVVSNHHCRPSMQIAVTVVACVNQK